MDDLRRIDLNLLLALHALLEEQHVSRAALRLNRSQPAVSHALAQLRGHFDDPLLVRSGGRLELTARAKQLQRPLAEALGKLNGLLSTSLFDPGKARREFRLGLSDYAARIVLPGLMRRMRSQAPGVDLAVTQGASREALIGRLIDGDLDIALGIFPDAPPDVRVRALFEDRFVCVADRESVADSKQMTFEDWLARPHVKHSLRPDAVDEVDKALLASGRKRRIALALPHWSTALELIEGTDLILTIANRAVMDLANHPRLMQFHPPLSLSAFTYQQAWHVRRDSDAGHAWLRQSIAECAAFQ